MLTVRRMEPGDVGGVYAAEQGCFGSEAWSREDFELLSLGGGAYITLVAEESGEICGYACASFVAGELEIASVAVVEKARRRGIARTLITEIERETDPDFAYLEVRVSNIPARRLYESLGFREYGVRKGYYSRPEEDAAVMKKEYRKDCR